MLTASVLVPSYRRPETLTRCLKGLAAQSVPPDEVLVAWQGDDAATRDAALAVAGARNLPLRPVHSPVAGIVPAENAALGASVGDVVLLIDDDATPPPDWVACHVAHYDDRSVGAVGGPAVNVRPDGTPYPTRAATPHGRLTWYGRTIGNMYDHPAEWRALPPIEVDHLVGYNLSLRRAAFGRFEDGLRPYWQHFELDACLAVRAAGCRVLFDFGNVVEHRPTGTAYAGGRDGDLEVKIYNAAYNRAFVLAKHSPAALRPVRLAYLLGVGSTGAPGLAALGPSVARYGAPGRELAILWRTWRATLAGWRAGARRRAG